MTRSEKKKALAFYLKQRYPVQIVSCEEGGYFAEVPDLPGCMTQGETIEELVELIEDAKRVWISASLDEGLEVPLAGTSIAFQFFHKPEVECPFDIPPDEFMQLVSPSRSGLKAAA